VKIMSDEKWYDNLPEQGVLCICNNDFIALIDRYEPDARGIPFVGSGQRFSNARPITPDEWWQLAPWQPIETAPYDTWVVVLDDSGNFFMASFYLGKWSNGYGLDINAKKWLPLP
jgi:hypothetical protein